MNQVQRIKQNKRRKMPARANDGSAVAVFKSTTLGDSPISLCLKQLQESAVLRQELKEQARNDAIKESINE